MTKLAGQSFERDLSVSADPDAAWGVLTDIQLLADWISIVGEVHELSRLERYTAVLEDRIGPFKLRADMDITATVVDEGRHIEIQASGRDRALDSRLTVSAEMRLTPRDTGCIVAVSGSYQVTGRAASAGAGIIRKKADAVIEQFFANAATQLSG